VECWLNLLGSAGAWFDAFLEGCDRFQMRLLLPRAFFEFNLGVSLYGAGLSFILSWRDFSFSRSLAVCFLVQFDIRLVRVGWGTEGSFWMALAMRWAVVR
jgi:hypothetical protein